MPALLFGQYEDVCRNMYVTSSNGVRVRNMPSLEGDILKVIPYGHSIESYKRTKEKQTIDGITDYWYSCKDPDGWIFGGYLADRLKANPIVGQWSAKGDIGWIFTINNGFVTGGKYRGDAGYGEYKLEPDNTITFYFEDSDEDGNNVKITEIKSKIFFINMDKINFPFGGVMVEIVRDNEIW